MVIRPCTAVAYDEALATLVQKGWLTVQDDLYTVTAVGKQLRDAAETETEELFNVGLWALDATEMEAMLSLLTQLKDGLAVEEPAAEELVVEDQTVEEPILA